MKKNILTDALGSCPSLKDFVSAILRTDAYIRWKLVSASCEGESCRAEFVSPAGSRASCSASPPRAGLLGSVLIFRSAVPMTWTP